MPRYYFNLCLEEAETTDLVGRDCADDVAALAEALREAGTALRHQLFFNKVEDLRSRSEDRPAASALCRRDPARLRARGAALSNADKAADEPAAGSGAARSFIYLIAGWSGFYVMLVELLGGRLIAPYFGSSIYVWGAVIFVFMVGLAIGYLAGGRASMRSPSIAKLALILLAAALTTTPILFAGGAILNAVYDAGLDPRAGSLAACAALYFIPTIFCGMVSPYAIRLLIRTRRQSGNDAGTLYFVSTLGSSAGTLLTAFYLVLWFEVNTILITAIGVSVLFGAIGLTAFRRTASAT